MGSNSEVTDVAWQLPDPGRREFRRMLVFSLAMHAGLLLLFSWSPGSKVVVPRGVIAVDLVALEAPRPAARPAPAPPKPAAPPEPARPLPPKAPVKEKIVLPKEAAMPKAKPKPAPAARRELTPEDLEKTTQRDYSDVMAQLRSEVPEDLPPVEESEAAPAGTAAPAGVPSGTAAPIPPEEAAWIRRAKIHVRQNWTLTAGFRTQALETHVLVDLDAAGNILGDPKIVRRSGNPWYDDSVVRALSKASPLPPPPAAGEWAFVFIPEDSF